MTEIEACLRKTLPFWGGLPDEERALLLKYANVHSFPKGTVTFSPLHEDSGIQVVLEGQLRISFQTEQGGELLLYQLGGGELCIFSMLSLSKQFHWDINIETMRDSKIIMISEAIYQTVSKRNLKMERYNTELIFERMSEVIKITSEYALASTEQRLASLLLRYQMLSGENCLKVTHESMARDIGTAREVVSRILKQFLDAGLIETGRGRVKVVNREGLLMVKNGK